MVPLPVNVLRIIPKKWKPNSVYPCGLSEKENEKRDLVLLTKLSKYPNVSDHALGSLTPAIIATIRHEKNNRTRTFFFGAPIKDTAII